MRSTSALHLILLSLTTSSLCAPIPIPAEDCSHYASCRLSLLSPQRSIIQQSKESSHLQEPHFPTHQLELSKHTHIVEVRLLEHHLTTPEISTRPEPPIKNLKLNAFVEAAHRDKASAREKLHVLGHKSPSTKAEAMPAISKSQSPNSKDTEVSKYGFTASVFKKIQLVASARGRKCGTTDATAETEHKYRDGTVTITYTYGYGYIRTDYTSMLVVSIVAIFLLVIIVVELLDKVIETSRALGLDQGAIRLEDCDCERGHGCPPYAYAPKTFRLMPSPPPRFARSPSQPAQEEKVDEKSQELESQAA